MGEVNDQSPFAYILQLPQISLKLIVSILMKIDMIMKAYLKNAIPEVAQI